MQPQAVALGEVANGLQGVDRHGGRGAGGGNHHAGRVAGGQVLFDGVRQCLGRHCMVCVGGDGADMVLAEPGQDRRLVDRAVGMG